MLVLELLLLVGIVALQRHFFLESQGNIAQLKSLFPSFELTGEHISTDDPEQIVIPTGNEDFRQILLATNAYLRKNKGSVDFNIVRNITERACSAQETRVASRVSLPLYLGLMGTFLGVVSGLLTMLFNGGLSNADGLDHAVNGLLGGVVLAMLVSLLGLALTTYLNAFLLKNAVAQRDEYRNRYYNFLQTELLPTLDHSLYTALDGFKANILNFNRGFSDSLKVFDNSFGENIGYLKETIGGMAGQVKAVTENTQVQLQFLETLQKIGYNKMAEANIKVFDQLQKAAPLLVSFIQEQQTLTENMSGANQLVSGVSGLLDRILTFEEGINALGRDLQQSDVLGSDVLNEVRRQLGALHQKEGLIREYSQKTNLEIEDYLKGSLEKIIELRRRIESNMTDAFNFEAEGNVMQNLHHLQTINRNIDELQRRLAASQSMPGIERKLEQLVELLANGAAVQPIRRRRWFWTWLNFKN